MATGQRSPRKARPARFSSSYVADAVQYARDVVKGRVVACKYVRQACKRHLDDLAKVKTAEWPYKFDDPKAHRVCRFIEKLPHTKGKWARPQRGVVNTIKLEPWQLFFVCTLFGWVEKTTGLRRFTEAYLEVPRKNAKSTLAAAIGLYMLVMDNEYGAEVYSGATKEKQAMEVFRPARLMVKRTPALQRIFGLEVNVKSLTREDDGSRFEPVVGNPGDGSSPSCAIVDEYHEHETPILHDTMQTGMAAREQPLLLNITTAGNNIGGPCFILHEDLIKVLDGLIENENLFGVIYTLDEGDDFKTEVSLRKANPNYGVSVFEAYLKKQQQQAIQFAHKQNGILTKHFDVWVNAATAWMNMEKWRAAGDSSLNIEEFLGNECFNANDLSAKIDLASSSYVFKRLEEDDKVHYYVFGRHFAPEDTAMDGDHQHYDKWVREGYLIAHPGPEIKLNSIQEDIREQARRFDTQVLAFDPWSALQMQQDLTDEFGEEVVIDIPQTVQFLSDPMKEIQAATYAGRLHHNNDPVIMWAMSNVVVQEDFKGNIFPRKPKKNSPRKIDPVVAMITAFNRAYAAPMPDRYTSSTGRIV